MWHDEIADTNSSSGLYRVLSPRKAGSEEAAMTGFSGARIKVGIGGRDEFFFVVSVGQNNLAVDVVDLRSTNQSANRFGKDVVSVQIMRKRIPAIN